VLALELYAHGLMTDSAMYDAFLAQETSGGEARADTAVRC